MNEEIRRRDEASSPVMLERGRLGNRVVAVLSLALLLFSVIGMLVVMTNAHALARAQISAPSVSEGPMKRHPPTPFPTLTVVPSPTASATPAPAPSPTFTATPTTVATIPANATPSVEATVSSVTGEVGSSPGRTTGASPPTGSTASPAKGEGPVLLLTIGIAAGFLLLAVGLALRVGLRPARKVKLRPSGAAPWQRVPPADLDDLVSSSHSGEQQLPMTDTLPYATGKSLSSRKEVLSTRSLPVPKRRSMVLAQHFLKPTRLKALNTTNPSPGARSRSSTLTGQNARSIAGIRERARERESKNAQQMSSLPGVSSDQQVALPYVALGEHRKDMH